MLDSSFAHGTDDIAWWIDRYVTDQLPLKRETTRSAYTLILRQFLTWLAQQPGHESPFDPAADLTHTACQMYLCGELAKTSLSHRERVKSILSGFTDCPVCLPVTA